MAHEDFRIKMGIRERQGSCPTVVWVSFGIVAKWKTRRVEDSNGSEISESVGEKVLELWIATE